ncbi:MAG: head maturation protease, ClpP-related [Wenzhouxiangella sp.]
MPKHWYKIQAEAGSKVANVSIRGYIGEWGVSDREFIRDVEAAGEVEEIHVSINSRGGEVDHGLAIYNYLRNHPALVTVRVEGVAASSASIIAMAGDTIIMPANAMMMVHNPWTFAIGNAAELHKVAADLEKFEAALMATYMARTDKPEAEIKALLDGDTWLLAEEAKELGFADIVEPLRKSAAAAMAEALNVPDEILAKIQAMDEPESPTPEPEQDPAPAPEPTPEPDPAPAPENTPADIAALCVKNGFGALAADWIREGVTVAEAGKRVIAAKAAADEQLRINKTIQPVAVVTEPDQDIKKSWGGAFSKLKG